MDFVEYVGLYKTGIDDWLKNHLKLVRKRGFSSNAKCLSNKKPDKIIRLRLPVPLKNKIAGLD